jgi:toxin ParE1/3/4
MANYHFTNRAVDDLSSIWNYTIEEWSERQAEKYYNLIITTCTELATNPKRGKTYDIISLDVLGYKCGEHITF